MVQPVVSPARRSKESAAGGEALGSPAGRRLSLRRQDSALGHRISHIGTAMPAATPASAPVRAPSPRIQSEVRQSPWLTYWWRAISLAARPRPTTAAKAPSNGMEFAAWRSTLRAICAFTSGRRVCQPSLSERGWPMVAFQRAPHAHLQGITSRPQVGAARGKHRHMPLRAGAAGPLQ